MTETKHVKTKVCLVGDAGVGKTSLVHRYVLDQFDDAYLTTIGTKVRKKDLRLVDPSRDLVVELNMAIWDIMGQEGFRELLKDAYFHGAHGDPIPRSGASGQPATRIRASMGPIEPG